MKYHTKYCSHKTQCLTFISQILFVDMYCYENCGVYMLLLFN